MKKFENFTKALENLKAVYQYQEPYDNVVLTGLVALFEICFEQSWKAMKEALENHGFSEGRTGSPKLVIKTAYQAGMIDDEHLWISALQSRNNVAHAYNEAIALDIVTQTREKYVVMFEHLADTVKADWI